MQQLVVTLVICFPLFLWSDLEQVANLHTLQKMNVNMTSLCVLHCIQAMKDCSSLFSCNISDDLFTCSRNFIHVLACVNMLKIKKFLLDILSFFKL